MNQNSKDTRPDHPPAAGALDGATYVLKLYVTGATPRSLRAIENIERICRENLAGQFELEVIDIMHRPESAKDGGIVAVPTLVKELPHPLRRIIGDLSDTERVLVGLNISEKIDLRPR